MPPELDPSDIASTSSLRLPQPRLAESSVRMGDTVVRFLTDDALFDACATRIAFTFRSGGTSVGPYAGLNLSLVVGDDPSAVRANRRMLLEAFGAASLCDRLVVPKQVHGSTIRDARDEREVRAATEEGADGILCTQAGMPVLLNFADCVPVILVAPDGSFAVLHSGWRGTIASIAGLGIERLACATGCKASEINCYIGPHIGACCYEVADELVKQFVARFGTACDAGKSHLDLGACVTAALLSAGAQEGRIADAGICTSCHRDTLYSYRAEGGVTGRHGAFAIKGEAS